MTKTTQRLIISIGVILAAALFVVIFTSTPSGQNTTPIVLSRTFDKSPTGFSFQYPDDWEYLIPAQGILLAGFPMTLYENEPGPTLTVQRLTPLSIMGNLETALDSYLQNGPLRVPDKWQITTPAYATTLEGRPAYAVALEGSDIEGSDPLWTQFLVTTAENTFIYLFITTTPVTMKVRFTPLFDAILASVRILE